MNEKHIHQHLHTDGNHTHHDCDGAGHRHHHHADGSCCCHKHEIEFHKLDVKLVIRIGISAICFIIGAFTPVSELTAKILFSAAAIICGWDIVISALRNLFTLKFFDEYFLMTFAAAAACAVGEFKEAAAVILLYRIGEFLQSCAIKHSRKTIYSLSAEGFKCSEKSISDKKFITKFAGVYTPIVLILAVMIVVLLPLLGNVAWSDSVYRALTFLVVACPCAIVISVPMAYFAGIAAASGKGIFFRDSTALDLHSAGKLSCCNVVAGAHREITLLSAEACDDMGQADLVYYGSDKRTEKLAGAIARKTRRLVAVNIAFIVIVKCTVLVLGAFGISPLWFAVFADSGVMILTVLHSLTAFRIPKI